MRDEDKTKEQLLEELKELRRQTEKTLSQGYPLFAPLMETDQAGQAADKLEQSISLLQATLESTADGLLVTDRSGKIVTYNQKLAQMWRLPEAVLASREFDQAQAFVLEQLKEPEGCVRIVQKLFDQPETESHDLLEFKDGRVFERFSQPQRIGENIVGRVWSYRDVTARKRAEEALKESEEHYRSLFDNMLNGFAYCQMLFEGNRPVDFIYLQVNTAFEGLTGLKDVTGKRVSAVIPGIRESDPELFEIYGRVALTGKPERFESYLASLGMWFSISVYSPQKEYFVALFDVITERKRAEEALKESEEKYRKLMESANDAVFIAEVDTGIIIDANPKAQELLGLPLEKIIGMHQSRIHPPDQAEKYRAIFLDHCKERGITTEDIFVVDSAGRHIPVEISAGAIEVRGKNLIYGIFRDIRDRRRSEEALRRSEEKYRQLVDQIPAVVFKGYGDWSVDFFDDKIEELTGYAKEDFNSRRIKWSGLILPEDLEDVTRPFVEGLKTNGSYVREHRILRKDGEIRWVQCWGQIFLDPAGNIEHISGVTFDVTSRKQIEEALRQSEEKYRLLVDQIPAVVYRGYADWSLDCFDQKIEEITGYAMEEFNSRQKKWLDLIFPEDLDQAKKLFEEAQKGDGSYVTEHRIRKKNGEVRWIQARNRIICDAAGKVEYISGVFFDITARKELADQLIKAQRMEAVGILAGGLAHDFNNLLTAIMGYSEIMLLDLRKEDPFSAYINEIMKAAAQGASLTNQLLAFSRKQILQPQVVNLNDVVLDMEKMLRRLIGEDIDLVTRIDQELALVKADPGQIEQIIMNLAVNARDALPHGGSLTIETANIYLDQAYARSHVGVTPGSYVMLAMSDDGVGMDAETLSHIFEPFFTTKASGKGTGLGLATVYGIVKQSGGSIWVYSEPGQGTTFKVYLPRFAEGVLEPKPKAAVPNALGGDETILLVEDDATLRELISTALRRYGYTVLEASHGGEAILICEGEQTPIQLLLTDVVMPQVSGSALAERLILLRPEMKVLFMSGYTHDAVVHHGVLDSGVNFIAKPFRLLNLAQKVREVLDSGEANQLP